MTGDGGFAVHEPGHEVGAVAAEVCEGSVSVLGGIGEEGEEVGGDVDLDWAFVTVADDGFDDGAEVAGFEEIVGLGVAGVPGGFEVDEDFDVTLFRGMLNGESVGVGEGEGLFHENVYAEGGGLFDDVAVLAGGGEDEDGLEMGGGGHLSDGAEVHGGGEVVLGGVGVPEALVWLDDADELDVRALEDSPSGGEGALVEEAVDMAVSEADDANVHGSLG